jgi:hypothetical protein
MANESINFKSVGVLGVKKTGEWISMSNCSLESIYMDKNINLTFKSGKNQ